MQCERVDSCFVCARKRFTELFSGDVSLILPFDMAKWYTGFTLCRVCYLECSADRANGVLRWDAMVHDLICYLKAAGWNGTKDFWYFHFIFRSTWYVTYAAVICLCIICSLSNWHIGGRQVLCIALFLSLLQFSKWWTQDEKSQQTFKSENLWICTEWKSRWKLMDDSINCFYSCFYRFSFGVDGH